jgi:hypothetical protein
VEKVMAISAKADQVAVFERQFRVLVQVLDVVDGRRLSLSSIPLAALALVAVPAEDPLSLVLPLAGLVECLGVHGSSLYASARAIARAPRLSMRVPVSMAATGKV